MTAATVKARKADLLHIPMELQEAIKKAAAAAGLTWQEWARGCMRREIARAELEAPKR